MEKATSGREVGGKQSRPQYGEETHTAEGSAGCKSRHSTVEKHFRPVGRRDIHQGAKPWGTTSGQTIDRTQIKTPPGLNKTSHDLLWAEVVRISNEGTSRWWCTLLRSVTKGSTSGQSSGVSR